MAHGLRLVLVVTDGVDGQTETRRVEPGEEAEGHRRQREAQVVEQQRGVDRIRRRRGHHAGPGADVLPAGRQLAGGDRQAQRGDGEIVPAHAEDDHAQRRRRQRRHDTAHRQAQRKAGVELRHVEDELRAAALRSGVRGHRIVEAHLRHRRGVHADAEEDHVAEGVVSRLAAQQIPGQGQNDEQPQFGELRKVGREEPWPKNADHAQRDDGDDVSQSAIHAPGSPTSDTGDGARASSGATPEPPQAAGRRRPAGIPRPAGSLRTAPPRPAPARPRSRRPDCPARP